MNSQDLPVDTVNDIWWHAQEQDERWIYEHTYEEYDMKVSELIPSKYLAKADFDEDGTTLTIKKVEIEDLGRDDQTERKPIMYFRENPKGMVLNRSSLRLLESCFGDDIEPWTGKKVIIYVDPTVSFQGRIVGGLRLRVPRPPKTAEKAPPSTIAKEFDADIDDSNIPF